MTRILLMAIVTLLVIPASVGVSITQCAHSGRLYLVDEPKEMSCGMNAGSGCMIHMSLKVSDFSDSHGPDIQAPLACVQALASGIPQVFFVPKTLPSLNLFGPSPPGRGPNLLSQLRI
ncbi:MAG: hypothetical protein IJ840_09345 [Bacteroidales bacterium]|nr:hypothetical protein [Bacteroidales bacterium]